MNRNEFHAHRRLRASRTQQVRTLYVKKTKREKRRENAARAVWWILGASLLPLLFLLYTNKPGG